MGLSFSTIVLILAVSSVGQAVGLFAQSRSTGSHASMSWWALGTAMWVGGFIGDLPGAHIARWVAILLRNFMFIGGQAVVYAGVLRFLERPVPDRMLMAVVGAVVVESQVFHLVSDNPSIRYVCFSMASAGLFLAAALALVRHHRPVVRSGALVLGVVFGVAGGWMVLRAGVSAVTPIDVNGTPPSVVGAATYLLAFASSTAWTFGFLMLDNQRLQGEQADTNASLLQALEQVKTLRGILPICSHCKKIRNDAGAWQRVEAYVTEHTDATFTHGICHDCVDRYYSDEDLLLGEVGGPSRGPGSGRS